VKRRWFQIHLSTAVVLMFAAGGMLYLNFYFGVPRRDDTLTPNAPLVEYGWPFCAMVTQRFDGPQNWTVESDYFITYCELEGRKVRYRQINKETRSEVKKGIEYLFGPQWNPLEFAMNTGCAAIILLIVAVVIERGIQKPRTSRADGTACVC
jgi:hypothetical protein